MGTYGKYFCLIAAIAALWGCNRKPTPKREPTAKPATVQNAVKETDLTTVTLTPQAESRLGIETTAVESRPVERVRTFGGEVMPVSGRSVTVSAPLSGTLQGADDGVVLAAGKQVTKDRPLYRLLLALPERDLLSVQEAISLRKIEYDLAQPKRSGLSNCGRTRRGASGSGRRPRPSWPSPRRAWKRPRPAWSSSRRVISIRPPTGSPL